LAAKLLPGNVHSAEDWDELPLPEIERQQKLGKDVVTIKNDLVCGRAEVLANDRVYEIKLDGYRAVAISSKGKLSLVSRKRKSFNRQYLHIIEALSDLPENTVVDREVTARREATTAFRSRGTRADRKPWSAGQVGRVQVE
jgi:bifunctional non-homologous end joining protein LigD